MSCGESLRVKSILACGTGESASGLLLNSWVPHAPLYREHFRDKEAAPGIQYPLWRRQPTQPRQGRHNLAQGGSPGCLGERFIQAPYGATQWVPRGQRSRQNEGAKGGCLWQFAFAGATRHT